MRFTRYSIMSVVLVAGIIVFAAATYIMRTNFIRQPIAWRLLPAPMTSTQQPVPTKPKSVDQEVPSTTMMFFGDIMLGRNVEAKINKEHDPQYPFRQVHELYSSADRVVANLEGPIMAHHIPTPTGSTRFSFDPALAQALVDEGFSILSLANNHTLDYGPRVYSETRQWLLQRHIQPIGHPQKASSEYVDSEQIHGQPFVFIGFSAYPNAYTNDKVQLVADMRRKQPDAFIVIMMHWGNEYQVTHNQKQERFAHALIDAGADLIIGHHPHVVQDIAVYRNRAIFYSLGNFIFDQYFSKDTQQGLAIEMRLQQHSVDYVLHPLGSSMSQAFVMNNDDRRQFLASLASRSSTTTSSGVMQGTITLSR